MTVTREFVMPDDHPVLLGHFPGDPVVPGVVLMAWCEQLAADLVNTPVAVRHWPHVKFLHPLRPGQICRIALEEITDSRIAFRITAGSELIASGIFEWTLSRS
jgi:3-hydroxymyristoyl/3-hydroxydecanoyl-(acyl carrier protein) dehydratase